jgi:hypothetical protein
MKYFRNLAMILPVITILSLAADSGSIGGGNVICQLCRLPAALAESEQKTFQPVVKEISMKNLEKYAAIEVSVENSHASGDGKKSDIYLGVPLRTILSDMVPELKLEAMPEWKSAARRELVLEVKGSDGYPGLVTVAELAINKDGDRFLLATHRDGKLLENGPQLICKMDQARVRWIREVVSLRVTGLRD